MNQLANNQTKLYSNEFSISSHINIKKNQI